MNNTVPYTDIKDSGIKWIGSVPASWNVRTLYQLATRVNNKNSDLSEQNLLSLSYGKIKRKDINTNDGLLPASFDGYNIIEAGDIVLRLTDLQNDHTSLRVGHATERGIITSAYTTLRPINPAHSRYLYYLIHAFDLKKGFYGMGSGVRQGLNYDEVKELKIVVPLQKEQDAITSFLDAQCSNIDELISESKGIIEELKQWRAAIIQETVTKGLSDRTPRKKSQLEWIEDIPATWETARLKALFTFGKGLPITKENLVETGVAVISYGQIHSKTNLGTRITEDLIRYVPESYLTSNPDSLVEKYDLLMADTSEDLAGCGNCVYVETDGQLFAGYHTIILRSVHKRSNKYLSYLFKSDAWRSQIRTRVSGVKLFSISRKILGALTVLLPPEDEQIRIVEYLDEKCGLIDSIIAEKELLIAELEVYKRSLIYETVTGKRKVV